MSQSPHRNTARKVKGLARQLQESEALLKLKQAEFAMAIAEQERLRHRMHLLETVLPAFEQQLTLLDSKSTSHDHSRGFGGQASRSSTPAGASPMQEQAYSPCQSQSQSAHSGSQPGSQQREPPQPAPIASEVLAAFIKGEADQEALLYRLEIKRPMQEAMQQSFIANNRMSDQLPVGVSAHTQMHSPLQPPMQAMVETMAGTSSWQQSLGSAKRMRDISLRIIEYWGNLVHSLALDLATLAVHPGRTEMLHKMEATLARFHEEGMAMIMENEESWFALYGINLEKGQPEALPDGHWRDVCREMAITDEQLLQLREALVFYEERVGQVMEERRQLKAQLAIVLGQSPQGMPLSDTPVLAQAVRIEELAQRLAANLLSERTARQSLRFFANGVGVFTPLQMAKLLVGSWPYIPDGVAMWYTATGRAAQETAPPPPPQ